MINILPAWLFLLGLVFCSSSVALASNSERQTIKALYIPLADHYAGVLAFERYAKQMEHADLTIEKMANWDLLRATFQEGKADIAFVMSPLALDMYLDEPSFRWVGLMHRDGNALAVNERFLEDLILPSLRADRKPNADIANVFKTSRSKIGHPIQVGVPHVLSTHSVVLYSFLKEHGATLSWTSNRPADTLIFTLPPPKAPAYIRAQANRNRKAAFQQSLPWADVVETGNYGKIAWYSKDVVKWPKGHVECLIIASKAALANKFHAVEEVVKTIHLAGADIERARSEGGQAMVELTRLIRTHIPEHSSAAIQASLAPELRVINYQFLTPDIPGLNHIMGLAVESGLLPQAVNLHEFVDPRFVAPQKEGGIHDE